MDTGKGYVRLPGATPEIVPDGPGPRRARLIDIWLASRIVKATANLGRLARPTEMMEGTLRKKDYMPAELSSPESIANPAGRTGCPCFFAPVWSRLFTGFRSLRPGP